MTTARDTEASTPHGAHSETNFITPLLQMQGIVRRFGATVALNRVDFEVAQGEIHALLGENGAGKSTLMHVLSGLLRPDAGNITLCGKELQIASPRQARAEGIAMVHQHFTLVPAFTVAENLALDTPPRQPFPAGFAGKPPSRIRYAAQDAAAYSLERAHSLGWTLDPEARVADLSVGAQQRVEIVKALATEAPLLIFDEPTAVLSADEVEELFAVLRRLRDQGRTIILIAHKLAEILAVADRVTVLRRGIKVATARTLDTNAEELAGWMVAGKAAEGEAATGSEATSSRKDTISSRRDAKTQSDLKQSSMEEPDRFFEPQKGAKAQKGSGLRTEAVTVMGDRGEEAIRSIVLEVRPGEIFGIGGVDGNGQNELAEALVGLRSLRSGRLTWNGKPFAVGISPRIGYIPQDRRRAGLAVTMTIEENLLLEAAQEKAFRFGPFLRRKALHHLADDLIRQFDIRTPSGRLPASALSGGNQQKIVVARALRSQPEWIVAVNPTRGLDIGATRFVHSQLKQARSRGAAVLLISTDLDELAALADRAAILSAGVLKAADLSQTDATELGLLLGGSHSQAPGEKRGV